MLQAVCQIDDVDAVAAAVIDWELGNWDEIGIWCGADADASDRGKGMDGWMFVWWVLILQVSGRVGPG